MADVSRRTRMHTERRPLQNPGGRNGAVSALWTEAQRRLNPAQTDALLCQLIDIFSPSLQEHAIVEFCHHYFLSRGVDAIRVPVGSTRRSNVLARIGTGPVDLLFLGHLDTVQKWHQKEYRHLRQGDFISGLGAADMKSGCAALMEAFVALHQSMELLPEDPTRPSIALALVVGEESSGDGSTALMEYLKEEGSNPSMAVIAEPTGLQLCYKHFGYLEVLLTTHGRRAHAALPEQGDNAIDAMLQLLSGLRASASPTPEEAALLKALVFNVREMRGGGEAFVVPEYCEAVLDVHFPPSVALQSVKGLLKHRLKHEQSELPQHRCHMHQKFGSDGYVLDAESDAIQAMLQAQTLAGLQLFDEKQFNAKQFEPRLADPEQSQSETAPGKSAGLASSSSEGVFRSHSDGNILWAQGSRPVVIGPGDLSMAHTLHERVSVHELHQATELYLSLGVLCGMKSHQKAITRS